jgi:DNA-binding LacI/PurR family transcriptional regulator
VRQPLTQMAAEAVRMALEASQHGPTDPAPRLELATSLTLHDSTAPPRSGQQPDGASDAPNRGSS